MINGIRKGAMRLDSWINEATGLGVSGIDRLKGTTYVRSEKIEHRTLTELYAGSDLASVVVERVVKDALRQGYRVTGEGFTPAIEQEVYEWAEQNYEVTKNVLTSRIYARLYGGCGLFLGADDGSFIEPRKEASEIKMVRPVPAQELEVILYYDEEQDILTNRFGDPAIYRMMMRSPTKTTNTPVHESRVQAFQGVLSTQDRLIECNGWGDSVLLRSIESIRAFDQAFLSLMQLAGESSLGIYGVKNLLKNLNGQNMDELAARFQLIDRGKSSLKSIVIDSDGESFRRENINLDQNANMLDKAMIRVSAATQIPVTILFGQSPAGMNATGESDFQAWYDSVAQEQTLNIGPAIEELYTTLLSQPDSPLKGVLPETGLQVEFPSLWQFSPTEAAALYQMKSQADLGYVNSGVLAKDEVAIARASEPNNHGFPNIDITDRLAAKELSTPDEDVLVEEPSDEEPDSE